MDALPPCSESVIRAKRMTDKNKLVGMSVIRQPSVLHECSRGQRLDDGSHGGLVPAVLAVSDQRRDMVANSDGVAR